MLPRQHWWTGHIQTRVDADWSSLDNSNPGESNERVYDEDDGIDSPVDDGANADRDVDDAVFSMDPVTIAKSDGGVTGYHRRHDHLHPDYQLHRREPLTTWWLRTFFHQGLVFTGNGTISTTDFSFANPTDPAILGANDGSAPVTITWNLGDTVVSTDEPLIITYTARVADVSGNFLGEGLDNAASIEYDNAQGGHQSPAPVTDGLTVVEPWISTVKTVLNASDPGVGGGRYPDLYSGPDQWR